LGQVLISFLSRARDALHECRFFATLQESLGIQEFVELDHLGHQPGPAGLMVDAQVRSIVAVEVLVEKDVVAPLGIGLELFRAAVDGSPASLS
jgi:hypothetical protein